jgi:excisionase family DNA binding protein
MQTQVGDYWTIQGVARVLDSSYFRIYRLIRKHQVPHIVIGKAILVKLADVQQVAAK